MEKCALTQFRSPNKIEVNSINGDHYRVHIVEKATNWDEGTRSLQSRLDALGRVDNHRLVWNRDSGVQQAWGRGRERIKAKQKVKAKG